MFRGADTARMRSDAAAPIKDYEDLSFEMLYRACPSLEDEPFFTLHMGVAVHLGLDWVECLQYVLELRRGVVH